MAAVGTLIAGGFVSALAFAISGLMGWTRSFEQLRAQGKPVLSSIGRGVVAVIAAIIGVLLLPKAGEIKPAAAPVASTQPSFGKLEAIDACKEGILARAAHPSTVNFPLLDYEFRHTAPGRSEVLMSFTAKNGFNLELSYDAQCEFDGMVVQTVLISEARG